MQWILVFILNSGIRFGSAGIDGNFHFAFNTHGSSLLTSLSVWGSRVKESLNSGIYIDNVNIL